MEAGSKVRRLSHPLSAYVCAAPLMPLVTPEAAVTPRHSKEADAHEPDRGWAALSCPPAPAPQWTQRAGPCQSLDFHTLLLPQGMRAAAESGIGEVPFLLTLPQHGSWAPHGNPRQAPAGQNGCADEGGSALAAPGPRRPLTTCLFCCSSGQDRSSWGLA